MNLSNTTYISQEEYLNTERLALDKLEYFDGKVYFRGFKSFAHNEIFANTFGHIGIDFKGKSLKMFGSDLRIHIPKNTYYCYPEISIYSEEPIAIDDNLDTATNPTVLFEIITPSAQINDQIVKFELYRAIDSLQEYLMINSEKVQVLKYSRNPDNSWLMIVYESLEDVFSIQSIGVELKLSDIYFDVNFKQFD